MKKEEFIGVGRRKRAVSSVRLRPQGSGKINVNGKDMADYFSVELQRKCALAPFVKLDLMNKYDLIIRAKGGGMEAQATATQLGIARALVKEDGERHQDLKACGYLTRDARKRERKKYGLAGARKRFQFSKR